MKTRKKPAAKAGKAPARPIFQPDRLPELRAESAALWKLLSEGGSECLWVALTDRIDAAIERLDKDPYDGPTEALEVIAIRGLIDALFTLECAERDMKEFTLDTFDYESEAGKREGGAT